MAIPISGLSLGGCGAELLERALRRVAGVVAVYANRATEMAYVTYNADAFNVAAVSGAFHAAGLSTSSPGTWRPL